ncbi:DMT family transporter [Croceicoccus naphthovorans]|uniref:EamA domain-containing protein n=1 Tax=Croceicoccus naphthovorans TaxID=1348774 RepID=A0A0G3XF74_9SPHN|nr:DMT family transporter [Croceicoccus naphthovorans]AKM10165.1 hypothetical protein AB433_09570 [Croceicoccus naphthovorans]MBB3990604.1 drug/metabolite transporter (DMT)-like permease [Croceicoccus naphthovorans]
MASGANIAVEGPRQRPLLALVFRLGSALALATMFMLVKLSHQEGVHITQILFARQVLVIPIFLGWLAWRGQLSVMRSDRLGSHGVRAVYGTIGMVFNFGAPILLPLAVATTLGFTAPIFAVLLSFFVLREHVGHWRWSATLLGFAGILIVIDPRGSTIPLTGALVGIGAAFMVALISIQIRDMTRTEHPIAIVTWFAIFSSPVLFIASLFGDWHISFDQVLLLIGIAVFGSIGQLLIALSLRMGQVSSVIVMDYSMLVWATLYGWTIFDSLPSATLWLGAPLVILAGTIIVWRESVLAKQRNSELAI